MKYTVKKITKGINAFKKYLFTAFDMAYEFVTGGAYGGVYSNIYYFCDAHNIDFEKILSMANYADTLNNGSYDLMALTGSTNITDAVYKYYLKK